MGENARSAAECDTETAPPDPDVSAPDSGRIGAGAGSAHNPTVLTQDYT